MSYELVGEDGPVGQLASTSGYGDLIDWAKRNGGMYLKAFVKTGRSEDPQLLRAELNTYISNFRNIPPDVRHTMMTLYKLLKTIKEIAIVPEV